MLRKNRWKGLLSPFISCGSYIAEGLPFVKLSKRLFFIKQVGCTSYVKQKLWKIKTTLQLDLVYNYQFKRIPQLGEDFI